MSKMNSEVKKLLEETKTWVLSTCAEKPNAIPVFFTAIQNDSLVLFDVFMNKTLLNLEKNDNVAVTVFNDSTLQGYQLKGKAVYTKDAALLEKGNAATSKFHLTTKGAVVVEVKDVYVLTPGPNNGKTCNEV
jgi:predicted pyridoxine 5'-phosphate oxidase superfamily flavin-nucleotide-binding protein